MNPIFTLLALASILIVNIECQPLADNNFGFIPYLAEQFNPSLKHHRARFRPFTTQFGSPSIMVRAGRSVDKREFQILTLFQIFLTSINFFLFGFLIL